MLGIPAGQGDGLATCGPLGTAERHANAPSPHGTPFDDLAKDFHEEAHPEEGGEDVKMMRDEAMLALVGGDPSFSREVSAGSFSNLFSDEASQAELQAAMSTLQDGLLRPTPPQARGHATSALQGLPGWLERSGGSSRSLGSASPGGLQRSGGSFSDAGGPGGGAAGHSGSPLASRPSGTS